VAVDCRDDEFRRSIERHLDIEEHELIPAVEGGG
jgi:hypothetical protein